MRLASALARLRFSDTVVQEDVDEALRLIHMSKVYIHVYRTVCVEVCVLKCVYIFVCMCVC